ncbi:MAG: FkbM family methyltransferase, partial [Candidatus Hodarchaeota archaeon]
IKVILEFPKINLNTVIRKINGINYKFYFNFASRYRGMYLSLNSLPIVNVLLKYLKRGTVFIDAGANIGYLSAIGAGLVGKKGQVHSFEPVPQYYRKLLEFKNLNKNYQIYTNNFALGESLGTSNISLSKTIIGWNTMISGLLTPNQVKETVKVEVKRLDDYIFKKKISNISLIKIDVEGYEYFLLKGLTEFFESSKESLPPLIIEIAPSVYPLIDKTLADLENLMMQYNYCAYSLDEKFQIDVKKLNKSRDVLFKQFN